MADETEEEPTNGGPIGGDKVGYGKPPKHTRFQPGHSGNPRGRSKGTKNLKTDLRDELNEKIVIREGDRSRQISKQRALVKSLVNGTIKGSARTTASLISMIMRLGETGEGAPELAEEGHEKDLEILRAYEAQLQWGHDADTPPPPVEPPDEQEEES